MAIFVFLFGTIIGSFLNVCIYRIPKNRSIIFPSSHCPACGTPLEWYCLIPILSFLLQKGQCRYCGEKISLQYPIIELINGISYMLLFNRFGLSIEFIFLAIIFSIVLIISGIDIKYQIIPDILNLLILGIGFLLKIFQHLFCDIPFYLKSSLLGLIVPGGFFLIIILISRGGMGGGDMKLIGALGFILGLRNAILNVFLSFFIGGIISLFLIILRIKTRKDAIPFGPFISLAFMITTLWGDSIWHLYGI